MVIDSPSASKLALIREFLRLNGTQAEIDRGDVLGRLGESLAAELAAASPAMTYGEFVAAPSAALRKAYEKHRQVWQGAYEHHVNGQFTEQELAELVAFMSGPVGQHYLESRWRIAAYVGSDTEHLIDEIGAEARTLLAPEDRG